MERTPARRRLAAFALVAVVLAVYVPHVGNGFAYDDHYQIEQNPNLSPNASWAASFREGTWEFMHGRGTHRSYYRPLMFVGFRLARAAGGGDPRAFHALSLALHLAAVLLAYVVLGQLGVRAPLAAAAVFLFALHPLAAETVYWMGSLQEQIVLLGLLGALVCFRAAYAAHGAARAVFAAAAALATAAGLLGKETGYVTIAPLVTLAALGLADRRRALRLTIPVWLATAACLGLRTAVLGTAPSAADAPSLLWSVARAGRALLWYVTTLAFPFPLTPVHPFPLGRALDIGDAAGLAAMAGLAAAAAFAWRRPGSRLWLSWLLLPLLPPLFHYFSGQVLLCQVVVAERHLYLSLLPAALMLVSLGARLVPRAARLPVLLAAGAACAVVTQGYGTTFRDDDAYFARAYRYYPTSGFVLNQLAAGHIRRGELQAALPLLEEAVQREPELVQAWLNLGTILLQTDRAAEAATALSRAVAEEPSIVGGHLLLAQALLKSGRREEAVPELQAVVLAAPGDVEARDSLATLLYLRGDTAAAVAHWELVVAADPERAQALYNLGVAYREMGQPERARPYLDRYLRLPGNDGDPARAGARTWLAGRL